MNGFLELMGQGKRFQASDAPAGTPIAKGFKDWAKANKVRMPSKVEVAYALLRLPSLRLKPAGEKALRKLHESATNAFAASEVT